MYYRDNPYCIEALFDVYKKSIKASQWKSSTQRFKHDYLSEIYELYEEIQNGTYHSGPTSDFLVNERGKIRLVHGNTIRDRVVRHALCDNVLMPAISKKIVYDNAASQIGKGTDFCRDRLKQHLREYFRMYGNDGFILIGDIKKYYDNIQHKVVKQQLFPMIDDTSKALLSEVLDQMKVDVSVMTEAEYQKALDVFDSVAFFNKYHNQGKTGNRFLYKSMRTGDQVAQVVGIYYLNCIDNLIQIVHGHGLYGRFNDDFYVIFNNKEDLESLLVEIRKELSEIGLHLNEKKTVICRIDRPFKFMKNQYYLTETGRVVEKVNRKNLQRERKKLKKLKAVGVPYSEIEIQFKSWMGAYHRIMSKQQIRNMNQWFAENVKEGKSNE